MGFLAALFVGAALFKDISVLAITGTIFIIGTIGVYFFSDQIDWWWFQKNPPRIDDRMRELFIQRFPFYQNLSKEDRSKFETRVELYVNAKEYIPNGWKSVPYDIQCWVAACAIILTFGKSDYLLNRFERIVIYPHSFPSPQYPELFHASEHYEEDGVIIFSSEKLLPGIMQPQAYYNIGIHEMAQVFRITHPGYNYPEEMDWSIFLQITGYGKDKLLGYLGMESVTAWPVLVTLFFAFPAQFKELLNHDYKQVKDILNYEDRWNIF